MEDSSLYKAAFYQRRADRHIKHNRFDEAILSLQEAIEFISKSYDEVKTTAALKVIKVLEDEYKRQVERIKLQKLYYERYKSAQNDQKNPIGEEVIECTNSNLVTNSNELKLVIDRTIQDFDARYCSITNKNVNNTQNEETHSQLVSYEDLDVDLPPLELPTFDFSNFRNVIE